MERTIRALAILVVGVAFLFPPPPAYGEVQNTQTPGEVQTPPEPEMPHQLTHEREQPAVKPSEVSTPLKDQEPGTTSKADSFPNYGEKIEDDPHLRGEEIQNPVQKEVPITHELIENPASQRWIRNPLYREEIKAPTNFQEAIEEPTEEVDDPVNAPEWVEEPEFQEWVRNPAFQEEPEERNAARVLGKIFATPATHPKLFEHIKGSSAWRHLENGSIWEKDHDNHGGKQYKMWEREKDWEKHRPPKDIYYNGQQRIR